MFKCQNKINWCTFFARAKSRLHAPGDQQELGISTAHATRGDARRTVLQGKTRLSVNNCPFFFFAQMNRSIHRYPDIYIFYFFTHFLFCHTDLSLYLFCLLFKNTLCQNFLYCDWSWKYFALFKRCSIMEFLESMSPSFMKWIKSGD